MKLTDKQKEARNILNGPAMHVALEGGSRSGKTFLIVRNVVARALKAQRSRHAILRFRFNHAKESIGMDTLPKVMELCFPEVRYKSNRADWCFTFPNQSEIWIGGLDDKERSEKVLGKEYVSIYLNEVSQLQWASRNIALTRLAQHCPYKLNGVERILPLKMYYDLNPPNKSHWCYQVFHKGIDPDSRKPLKNKENYAYYKINPVDNIENLPSEYIETLKNLPERMRKRFLDGEYGDSAPGALWTDDSLDKWRFDGGELPDMQRIVVSVDPSGSGDDENSGNDAIGITVLGLGTDGNGYLLEDLTLKAGPAKWGRVVTEAYDRWDADVIVGEVNYGGAMVGYVIDTQPKVNGRKRNFKVVTATRGKSIRAEPVSALHEQGKIRHVGRFNELEEELCGFTDHGYVGSKSPNRADAYIWGFTEMFPRLVKEPKSQIIIPRAYSRPGSWML